MPGIGWQGNVVADESTLSQHCEPGLNVSVQLGDYKLW